VLGEWGTARTPFDAHAAKVNTDGYHNHRVNIHSDTVSEVIVKDLWEDVSSVAS